MEFKNYLFDLYPGVPKKVSEDFPENDVKDFLKYFPEDFSLDERKDPDECSKELYDDLCKIFFDGDSKEKLKITSVRNICQKSIYKDGYFYTLFIDEGKYLLSSDYIGASSYWPKEKEGLTEGILGHLGISRTIGGHMLFPRGKGVPTVNTARGGEKGYYDRFDLTLYAIKEWFVGNKDTKIAYAIDNYSEWFELFFDNNGKNGFENFVEFFKLEGFIYEQNKIIDLINSDLENNQVVVLDKEDVCIAKTKEESIKYIRYMKNLNIIILERTKKFYYKDFSTS